MRDAQLSHCALKSKPCLNRSLHGISIRFNIYFLGHLVGIHKSSLAFWRFSRIYASSYLLTRKRCICDCVTDLGISLPLVYVGICTDSGIKTDKVDETCLHSRILFDRQNFTSSGFASVVVCLSLMRETIFISYLIVHVCW